jgi:agmatinase
MTLSKSLSTKSLSTKSLSILVAAALSGALNVSAALAAEVKPLEAPKPEPLDIPADLTEKLQALPKEKLEFITTGKSKAYMSPKVMFDRFRNRTPAEIEAMIDAMLVLTEQSKYHADTDPGSIPLNIESETFNAWKIKRPAELNPKREPGPINLNRYVGRSSGIPTFAGAPIALTPEDLKAGKVDIAIVGAPLDMGSGYRGAKGGPTALRTMSGANGNDMYTMIDPTKELNVVDYGDIAIDNMSTERSMEHVRSMVKEIAQTGAIPFIVGGDHSLEYSDVAAISDVYGKGNVGVVHFDAHYDAGPDGGGHLISHGQPIYRLIKEGHIPGKNYVQVGLRGAWPGPEAFHWMREQGFRYHTMAEVEKKGWESVMNAAVKEAREGPKYMYISFDVDVLDPAFMPGTGTPVAGGLMMREALPIVRRLCAETNIVGFEIVEVDPLLDTTYKTALNSNYIMHACMTGIAMHRLGLTQEHYLSPLSTDHAQTTGKTDGKVAGKKQTKE